MYCTYHPGVDLATNVRIEVGGMADRNSDSLQKGQLYLCRGSDIIYRPVRVLLEYSTKGG